MENIPKNKITSSHNYNNEKILSRISQDQIINIAMTHTDSYTFKKNSYSADLLDLIITKEEWDQLIRNAEIEIWKVFNKNKANIEIKLPKFMKVLAAISVLLIVIFLFTICLYTKFQGGNYLYSISIVCIISGTFIGIGLSTYNFFRKPRNFKSIEEQLDVSMRKFFKDINKKYENQLRFEYLHNKKCVECRVLRKEKIFNFNYNYNEQIYIKSKEE